MRTFVTANAGRLYPQGVSNGSPSDAAFADLERSVDGLAKRLKAAMQPGVIEGMVAEALKPFEGTLRAKAEQVRNASLPAHIRRQRESAARVRGAFQLPAAD